MSELHDGKGRLRSEIKADKVRCHDELINNVSNQAREAFKRPAYYNMKRDVIEKK